MPRHKLLLVGPIGALALTGCAMQTDGGPSLGEQAADHIYTGMQSFFFEDDPVAFTVIDFEQDTITWPDADAIHGSNAPQAMRSCSEDSLFFCGDITGSGRLFAVPRGEIPEQWTLGQMTFRLIGEHRPSDCQGDYVIRVEEGNESYALMRYSKSFGIKHILRAYQPREGHPYFDDDHIFTEPGVWADHDCS